MNPEDLYEWDERKRQINLEKHGVDFTKAYEFEWDTVVEQFDGREAYGEDRFKAIGLTGVDLYVMIYTPRHERIRVISLRKAERHEIRKYVSEN